MRILVIFTGGTIGSSTRQGYVSPDDACAYRLLQSFEQAEPTLDVQFSTCAPFTMLSENLSAEKLNRLISCLQSSTDNGYDGIIVAHGTDTLAYSAAAVAYTVQPTCPILFVSAAFPLDDMRSNGLDNFRAAVHFISQGKKGVFVSYKNAGERQVNIHFATRLKDYAEGSADLYGTDNPYATVDNENGRVTFLTTETAVPTIGETFCENPRILLIASAPEQAYDYDVDKYNAVIFLPYHSHTLNTDNINLVRFCERAKGRNLPLFVAGKSMDAPYESSKEYGKLALLPVATTRAHLYIQCWLAISLQKDVKEFVLSL